MNGFFKRLLKRQKGFTLIELLVVIAILGSLSAVAAPNVVGFIGKSKVDAAMAEEHNVQLAASIYSVENGGKQALNMSDVIPYLNGGTEFPWTISAGLVIPDTGNPLVP